MSRGYYDGDGRIPQRAEPSTQFMLILAMSLRERVIRISDLTGSSQSAVVREALRRFCDEFEAHELAEEDAPILPRLATVQPQEAAPAADGSVVKLAKELLAKLEAQQGGPKAAPKKQRKRKVA